MRDIRVYVEALAKLVDDYLTWWQLIVNGARRQCQQERSEIVHYDIGTPQTSTKAKDPVPTSS